MKIVSQVAATPADASPEIMQALKIELEQLKEEVATLRAAAVKPVLIQRPAPDPLFAQLWAYVNHGK